MSADTPQTPAAPSPAAAVAPKAHPAARRKAFAAIGGTVGLVALGVTAWHFGYGRWHVETDNAYVGGDLVQVVAQTAGTVVAVDARDTDAVRAGQVLVKLDPQDSAIALEHAEAALAAAVRGVRGQVSNVAGSGSEVAAREADVRRAQSELQRLSAERDRRMGLREREAVSAEVLADADAAVAGARASLAAAQGALSASRAQLMGARSAVEGTTLDDHPSVRAAAADVRAAYLANARSAIPAPVDGQVARRAVEVGSRVQPGSVLMTVVPLDALWVDANFKEDQLANVRIGQPVTLTSDFYGSAVTYTGHVQGLGAGTGSAFALLPAQNASGNWIKVVQRVPVRVALDPGPLREHPLRVGLSMQVDIDVHGDGAPLGAATAAATAAPDVDRTAVYDSDGQGADARVASIISANAG